ncbi:MESH protein, partial [Acromyrmex heyeri]
LLICSCSVFYYACTMYFIMHITGQQEYRSRQAGIISGIVLTYLIPILLVIICVGYRALKSRKQQRENEEVLARY